MAISIKDRKLLWVRSGNECAFPGCSQLLTLYENECSEVVVGEEAHIVSRAPGGPRGKGEVFGERIDGIQNLLLLCPTHHRIVDEQADIYTVEALRVIKEDHESRVRGRHVLDNTVRSLDPERISGMCDGIRTFGAWSIGETLLVVCVMGGDPARTSTNRWRGAGLIIKAVNARFGSVQLGIYSESDPDVEFSIEDDKLIVVEWSYDIDSGKFIPFLERRYSLVQLDAEPIVIRLVETAHLRWVSAEDMVSEYYRLLGNGDDQETIVYRLKSKGLLNPSAVIEALKQLRKDVELDGAAAEAATTIIMELEAFKEARPLGST